nr:immunoglobulin heavy chain junction region [Macaca mulatta]MOW93626.1 immunoglobulin heavy chain junction region [Macaca mulatta]MOW93734.1 immunoglobulin heavy chain junction region [Macaca mulatta]MOW94511.1 immunoglobulin heavy chain junction region [Macaca mulatta]MOW94633.1 immunoglobulin heavy chain junction region [Macaca mulatta]
CARDHGIAISARAGFFDYW